MAPMRTHTCFVLLDLFIDQILRLLHLELRVVRAHIRLVLVARIVLLPHGRLQPKIHSTALCLAWSGACNARFNAIDAVPSRA